MALVVFLGAVEKRLGVSATTRNWKTILRVLKALGVASAHG